MDQNVYWFDVPNGVLVDMTAIGGGTVLLRDVDFADMDASDFLM